jgi:hypothetical protein
MVAPKFNFPGLALAYDELAQRIRRHCGCDAEHERDARDQRHRREALDGIVFDVLVEHRRDAQRRRTAVQERVAVGVGARHRLARDGAAGTRPVIEDDLSKICRDMLGNETGNVVGRAAGREWHDQADRPVRIRLCGIRLCGGGTARSQAERDGCRDQQVRSGHDGPSRIRREGIVSTGAKLEAKAADISFTSRAEPQLR